MSPGCADPRLPLGLAIGAALTGLSWALGPPVLAVGFTVFVVAICFVQVGYATGW